MLGRGRAVEVGNATMSINTANCCFWLLSSLLPTPNSSDASHQVIKSTSVFGPAPCTAHPHSRPGAEGSNINVAWPAAGGAKYDLDVLAAMQALVLPAVSAHRPNIIFIAAGYDAARGDSMGGCMLSPPIYGILTNMLVAICSQIVVVLEGGYEPQLTAE